MLKGEPKAAAGEEKEKWIRGRTGASSKRLHRLSNSEWYARAIQERGEAEPDLRDVGCYDGEDVRVVFVLKMWSGPLAEIVTDFVKPVWPEYRIIEHCKTRHGHIVTVEQGVDDAP